MNPLAKQPRLSDTEAWALARVLHGHSVSPDVNVSQPIFTLLSQLLMIVPEYRRSMCRERLGDEALHQIAAANPEAPAPNEPPITLAANVPARQHLILADDLHKLPVPEYALDQYPIYYSCLNALVGTSGAGKSFVAVDIAGLLAVKGAKVIYIAAEGLFGYAPRWEAWKAHVGITECRNLIFWDSPVNFMELTEFQGFMSEISHYKPNLVIVDTVARCMAGGDENSTKDMGVFIRSCDRLTHELGCGVLAVHHTGKDGKMRGSTALFGACDSVLFLQRAESQITIYNSLDQGGKNKYSEEAAPRTVQLLPKQITRGTKVFDSAVLVDTVRVEINPREDVLTTNQRLILEAIEAYENGLKSSQLIEATQIQSSTVYRLLSNMKKWGWLEVFEDRYTLTPEGMKKL